MVDLRRTSSLPSTATTAPERLKSPKDEKRISESMEAMSMAPWEEVAIPRDVTKSEFPALRLTFPVEAVRRMAWSLSKS